MYSIEILAAFDFLPQEMVIGTLEYERLKGDASFRFSFNQEFLLRFPGLTISADLGKYLGMQAASGNLFSFLGDALPDRWGRALIDKKERMEAKEAERLPRSFDDFGYLVRIDDFSRMGALRFRLNGRYIGADDSKLNVPPITNLHSFIREAQMIEEAERKNTPYQKDWIDNVWRPGSSLGGARPKLNVVDEDGSLLIAKIPSIKDTYDVGLWEHFMCRLARKAGINVAESKVLRVGPTPYHTFLSKRFDRNGDKRIHFASSLTLTGLKDGDNAANNKGYIDIVDAMAGDIGINSLFRNTTELFRRIAFNILTGNHDDHFRNHGFLLHPDGWELSPAYDLNPSNERTQVLAVTPYSNSSSIKELYECSDYYLITKNEAKEIIEEVTTAVEQWCQIANTIKISTTEQERFSERFKWALSQAHALFPAKKKR
jgi:serine/threonine-protein kinase HipA